MNDFALPQIEDVKNYKDKLKVEKGWQVDSTLQFWIVGFVIMTSGILASQLVGPETPTNHKLNYC